MKLRAVLRFTPPDGFDGYRLLLAELIRVFRAAKTVDPEASLRVERDDGESFDAD